jgi:hypothetical protein
MRRTGMYDTEHWEELIVTIIGRLGVEGFFDTVAYVLREREEAASWGGERALRDFVAEAVADNGFNNGARVE